MPRIPTFEPQVQATNLPGVRMTAASGDTGAGEIAAGMNRLAAAAAGFAEREQQKQDTAALMSAERELQEWQNQALFNPDTGAFQQRGQNAFGLPDKLLPEWDQRVGEVESRLTERQKATFRERAGTMRVSMQRDLLRHVGSEAEQFHKTETTALVGTRLETALLYWNDPARFDKELREAQGVFLAGNDGLPPAAQQVGLLEIESKARASVVQKMVDTDPLGAQRYFDTWREKLTAADAAAAERLLKPAILDANAEREVDRALGVDVSEGEPADYEGYRRKLESGGDANAKNPNSSALGPDQFIAATWLDVVRQAKPAWAQGLSEAQLLALRTDPTKSAEMARVLDQRNAAALTKAGVPVNNPTLYAAHHFGADAAIKFAKADADTPMSAILSDEQLRANGYLRGKTKADTLANWARRAGGESVAGQVEQGNVDLNNRPVVKNDDGSISTVRSISFEEDGVEVLVPTISDDGKILSDEQAIAQYRKTGRHLGKFETAEAATEYARRLHVDQEARYLGPPSKGQTLARLNDIADPDLRKAAIAKYKTRLDIEEIGKAERAEAMTESINTKVEESNPSTPLRQVLSAEEYAWAAEQGKLPAWEGRMAQRLQGLEPKTDPAMFDALQTVLTRAENGDTAALAEVRKMDPTKLYTALDVQARDYVQNRRAAILKAASAGAEREDFASEDELLNTEVFDKLGITKNTGKDDSDESKATRYQFMTNYWSAVDTKQRELGRKLNSTEKQAIMRDLVIPFARTVKDRYLGFIDATETKRGFELGEVPAADERQIVAAYRKTYGVDPTPEQIRATYLRGQGYAPQLETQ